MSEQPQQPGQSLNISDSVLETVQIAGIAGRDQHVTQIQGKVESMTVLGSVQVNQPPVSAAKPLTQQEYRWRQVLLSKVKSFWIDGVLAKSLYMQVLIELGLEEQGEFVPAPMSGVEEFPSESRHSFPVGTIAADIFEGIGAGRTLLILGEPGAGKTVTLLKLAESLVARTESNLSQPLPVVINLSSWRKKRQSIADWLVQELYEIYGTSKSLGKAWVEQEQLILLLDGLDEVDAECRNDCVRALNQFIWNHGLTEMVVCCRIREYENLSEQLRLRSAIYIQPLTLGQIDQYMEQAGEQLAALKTVFNQNTEIKVFASSPLILSIMSLAYQGCSIDDIIQGGTVQEYRQLLFDTYINRMFEGARAASYTKKIVESVQKYPREKAQSWLIWMAQRMAQTSQTVFLIERMQPSYFQNRFQRIRYRLESAFISGLISGLVVLLKGGLFVGPIFGPIFGLFVGMFVGFSGNIKTVQTLKWSWKEAKNIFRTGLLRGMIVTGLVSALLTGLLEAVLWWSIDGPIGALARGVITGLFYGVIFGFIFGLILGLILGLIGGFRGLEMQKTFEPNQGIWKSSRNALIFGLIGELSYGLIFGVGLHDRLGYGLIFGPILLLIGGGTACLRHFALRLMLYRLGYIPWNYARFLDYAAERLFMQKVGGGYIFIHRMLLEHFAAMELKQKRS